MICVPLGRAIKSAKSAYNQTVNDQRSGKVTLKIQQIMLKVPPKVGKEVLIGGDTEGNRWMASLQISTIFGILVSTLSWTKPWPMLHSQSLRLFLERNSWSRSARGSIRERHQVKTFSEVSFVKVYTLHCWSLGIPDISPLGDTWFRPRWNLCNLAGQGEVTPWQTTWRRGCRSRWWGGGGGQWVGFQWQADAEVFVDPQIS